MNIDLLTDFFMWLTILNIVFIIFFYIMIRFGFDLVYNTFIKSFYLGTKEEFNKIKNYKRGFYIHYKFEGTVSTLNEIEKKIKLDSSIIRHLTVKYNKLDTTNEFFKNPK